ncbi:TolC family protein [Comamonas sp. J-3]|uniref:TolC family protein n=1 Tax=Comamonas trifloxystrobinivorans TaxID=3350256 RepID=UPI00372D4610
MQHALLHRSLPLRPLRPLALATSLLLCAVPLAAQEQAEPTAAEAANPAEPGTAQTPQTPQLPLALAAQLSPSSLAGDSARKQLLTALYTMLSEHPDVRKSRAALESAGHDVHTAQGERWPKFKVGTSQGNASIAQSQKRESYTAINAEVRMALFDGGAIDAGIRSAESTEAAQGSVLYTTRQNLLLDALTALLELHRFDTKARIAAESADTIGQLTRVEERRAELGAVGRNDLRQAASRRASALAQQHALQAQRSDAMARFVRFYNYAPGTALPDPQVPTHWLPASENAAQQASEQQSAELQEIAHTIAKAEAEVERAKAQRFPTLSAVVAHTRDPKGVLYTDGTRYGLELNWNFGNGFEMRDRILKALNELQAQQAQQEAVRRQVHEAASSSWGRWQAGREREAQLSDAVREARGAFEGYRRLLQVGRGSLSQVLDAQLDMQRLMLDEADALYDQRINTLRLVRTTGQLLPASLPAQWLDQLFANAATSAQYQPGRTPAAGSTEPTPLTAVQQLPLRLDPRLDPLLLALPAYQSTSQAVRW